MKPTKPAAEIKSHFVEIANLFKPTKSATKPRHLRSLQKRNEMQERHEAARKNLWHDFQTARRGELDFELVRCRLQAVFQINPWTDDGPRGPNYIGYPACDAPESLLTSKEQADFYEDVLKNNGYPDFVKLAAECRKTASTLEEANVKGTFEFQSLVDEHLRQAERYETFAKRPEQSSWGNLKKKRSHYLEDIRSKATFWKTLRTPPLRARIGDLVAEYERRDAILGDNDRFAAEVALLLQEEHSPWGALRAYLMPRDVGQRFARLLAAATTGNSLPARAAVTALNEMVSTLNVFATVYPKTFRKVGRTLNRWPMICSPHYRFADDADKIMAQVDLGKDFEFLLEAGARWDPTDPFTHVARNLYSHIKFKRTKDTADDFLPYFQAAVALPPIPPNPAATGHSDTVQKWWNVAKEAFLFTYPEPETLHLLADHIKGQAASSPGRIRARILVRLQTRFLSLFGRLAQRKLAENERDAVEKAAKAQ